MIIALLLSLLNVGLVVVPIGGAVGTLAGIDYYRRINGETPLFWSSGGDGGDGAGGGGYGGGGGGGYGGGGGNSSGNYTWPGNEPNVTVVKGGVRVSEYCQQYATVNITALTGQNYTLNPNQWGWTTADGGGLCMNVTSFNNETYATNTTAPQWSATWQYDAGPSDQPVHAYPNIMIHGGVLPVKLGKVEMMRLDVDWAYLDAGVAVVGSVAGTTSTKTKTTATAATTKAATTTKATTTTPAAAPAASSAAESSSPAAAAVTTTAGTTAAGTTTAGTTKAITARSVNDVTFSANVAVDMFFDPNAALAGLTSNATYEVMVWLAQFGEYTDPIGITDGIVASQVVNGVNFTLYTGTNDKKQHVLTWIAEVAAPSFNGSILPLITGLASLGIADYPTAADYLGYFAFGSEAYYSADKVTFEVERLSMDIW